MVRTRGFQLVTATRHLEPRQRIDAAATWTARGGFSAVSFLLEAVAQAAGWLISASTNFSQRGVPVTVDLLRLCGEPPADATLELVAEIVAWRDSTAVVRGRVLHEGRLLGEAEGGICGLIEAEQLEAEADRRAMYHELLQATAHDGGPPEFSSPPGAPVIERLDGSFARATWRITGGEELFADHFPRQPLLPGSLQVEALVDLARQMLVETTSPGKAPSVLRQIRFRRAVRPGDQLTLDVEVVTRTATDAVLTARALVDGQRATSIGEICFR